VSNIISYRHTSCCAMKELCDISCGTPKEAIGTLCYQLRGKSLTDPALTGMLGLGVSGSPPLIIYTAVVGERKANDHTHLPGSVRPFEDYVKSTTYAKDLNDYIAANSLGTVVEGPKVTNPITGNTVQLFTFLPDYPRLVGWWNANWNTLKIRDEAPKADEMPLTIGTPNIVEIRELKDGEAAAPTTPSLSTAEVEARANAINAATAFTAPAAAAQPFPRTVLGSNDIRDGSGTSVGRRVGRLPVAGVLGRTRRILRRRPVR